ncbi:DUF4332 domain-containing protein [Novipirellula galeiformis]|nr:DUF4332 domain-containing protein [Novipirellula galeiformis]
MSRIITILRAAHCRSTHHYFALDAFAQLKTPRGILLSNMLTKYYDAYLKGAKAPDTEFRDFKNHVLHVRDNHWGGAPRACEKWLRIAIEQLDNEQFQEAAYSLGVLSHYFTDPIMPLHTGSSEREGIVHRPMEWSVCKAYEEIYAELNHGKMRVEFQLANGDAWISDAVFAAAQASNPHYERLIEIYDLQRGVKNPPDGLNAEAREILSNMFGIAITGWARILERIAEQSKTTIPAMPLTMTTVIAAIQIPSKWVIRKIASVQEQQAIKALFAEFQSTGKVQTHLPEEVRLVRAERPMSASSTTPPIPTLTLPSEPVVQAPAKLASPILAPATETSSPPASTNTSVSDNLVDAPSIGPKTAARFANIGITTIGQFLASAPEQMASQLNTQWITPALIEDWQAQATFVTSIASLCGYKSQLLVAIDCRTPAQLAERDADELTAAIARYAQTKAGQRILRSSTPPDETNVARWIAEARECSQQRAA